MKDTQTMGTRLYTCFVGKTALIMRYVKSGVIEEYEPTIEDVYSKQSVIDNEACLLYITDTCGGAHHSSPMLEGQIRGGDGYLCVFSLDNSYSFQLTRAYVEKIRTLSNAPILLVGNKCDILPNDREVNNRDGELCSEAYGVSFFTTSAVTGKRVELCFSTLIRQIRNSEKEVNVESDTQCCKIC